MAYEDCIDEVLSQYPLTERQRRDLKIQIDADARCPWFRRNAYLATHTAAARTTRS